MRVYSEKAQIARERYLWDVENDDEGCVLEVCVVLKLRHGTAEKLADCIEKAGLPLNGYVEGAILEVLLGEDVIDREVDWLCEWMKEWPRR